MKAKLLCAASLFAFMLARVSGENPSPVPEFNIVIKNGTVYDGTGSEGRVADVAIRGDRIAGVGD
jgi:N-acyl-D-amino-acid deacylase